MIHCKSQRSELSSIDETLPVLKSKLLPKQGLIICVGDVITNLLVEHNFNPDLVITDGKTNVS